MAYTVARTRFQNASVRIPRVQMASAIRSPGTTPLRSAKGNRLQARDTAGVEHPLPAVRQGQDQRLMRLGLRLGLGIRRQDDFLPPAAGLELHRHLDVHRRRPRDSTGPARRPPPGWTGRRPWPSRRGCRPCRARHPAGDRRSWRARGSTGAYRGPPRTAPGPPRWPTFEHVPLGRPNPKAHRARVPGRQPCGIGRRSTRTRTESKRPLAVAF